MMLFSHVFPAFSILYNMILTQIHNRIVTQIHIFYFIYLAISTKEKHIIPGDGRASAPRISQIIGCVKNWIENGFPKTVFPLLASFASVSLNLIETDNCRCV